VSETLLPRPKVLTLFDRFVAGSSSKVKSSVQRGLRSALTTQYPKVEPFLDDILPKKAQLDLVKIPDRVRRD